MKLNWEQLNQWCDSLGESFYVLDLDRFEKNYDEFLKAFTDLYPNTCIGYSYKTNYIPEICATIDKKGGYAEVVSGMEFELALAMGVSPKRIIFNGPYKPYPVLEKALLEGSLVNIDSVTEAKQVLNIASQHSKSVLRVGVRTNLELDPDSTSRFGIDIFSPDFSEVLSLFRGTANIQLEGIHCHFPNRDLPSYTKRVDQLTKLLDTHFRDAPPKMIDIGGGFCSRMRPELAEQFSFSVPSFEQYAQTTAGVFARLFEGLNEKPRLYLEPGSALVADAMQFVAKVHEIKEVRGKAFAMMTGSRFNLGLISSKVNYPVEIYSEPNTSSRLFDSIDLTGYTCIEGDVLYRGLKARLAPGDFVAFENAGSYSVVFKPPFILPAPPIVAFSRNQPEGSVIRRQETNKDVFATYGLSGHTEVHHER